MHVISKVILATALGGFIVGPVSAPAFAHETTYPHHHTTMAIRTTRRSTAVALAQRQAKSPAG